MAVQHDNKQQPPMPPQPPQSSNCDDRRPVRGLGKKQPTTEISTKTSEKQNAVLDSLQRPLV